MNSTLNKIQQFLLLHREGTKKLREAEGVLSGGPAEYYHTKIDDYIKALFEKFAPFKVDDRVMIVFPPSIPKGSGWQHSKHFLIVGAKGTILEVDYMDEHFVADIVFDDETWIDQENKEQPVTQKHTFRFGEEKLKVI